MISEGLTARELIRRSVQTKATGMNRQQVGEETAKAQGREHQAACGIDEPGHLENLHHAEWKHTEWRRIGHVMTEQHMETYNPQADELARLRAFARQTLAATCPGTMAWRRVLEALGEAGGLCNASTLNADGDRVVCCREAGHYAPQDQPAGGGPGGWHRVGGVMWTDAGAATRPHQPA